MKPTEENIKALKLMGFKPEDESDYTGWWALDSWAFLLDHQKSIKSLIKRIISTNYLEGYDDGNSHRKPRHKLKDF